MALVLSGSGKRIRIDADKDWCFRFSAYVRARLPTYSVVEALRTLEGVDEKILKRPEVVHANSVLEVGELPGSIAISGQLATHLATDRRIISVQKSIWTDSIKSVQFYSFDEIQMIATGHGPLGSPIEILASGKSIRLEADEKHRLAFAEYVRTRLPSTPILEALREKLNRLDGVDENILKRTEVAHLPSVLEEGELPGCVATFGQVSMTVATDRRITHILQSMGSSSIRKVETYPYERIKSVRAGRSVYSPGAGVPYYRLEINFSGGGTFIRMKKDSCYAIADYVTAKINAA